MSNPGRRPSSASTLAASKLAEGLKHHREGRSVEAHAAYQEVLELHPDHADARHLLGVLEHQAGKHAAAIELIRDAIRLNGRVAYYHNNLGECWRALGEPEKALACYRHALELDARYPDPYANIGSVLRSQGRPAAALEYYEKALNFRSDDPRNQANAASAACDAQQFDRAIAHAREAVRLAPRQFEGWGVLGNALHGRGDQEAAIDALHRALALKPHDAPSWVSLGMAQHRLGKDEDAIASFQRALQLDPNEVRAYLSLGNLWHARRHHDRADQCFRKAIEVNPASAEAWNNWGLVAKDQGLLLPAVARLSRSLELDRNRGDVWNNLGVTWRRMAEVEKSLACYREATARGTSRGVAGSNYLYTQQFAPEMSPTQLCAEAKQWGDAIIAETRFSLPPLPARPAERRLRIGYLSPDFRRHPVAFFVLGLLTQHDRERCEIYAYADVRAPDQWTERCQRAVEHWVPVVGLSDEALAQRIRQDELDLLVDLVGHTAHNRLRVFAAKPARHQATFLGYPGTTGLQSMDFRISDRWADPPEASIGHYVERLLTLDRCAWCYAPPAEVPTGKGANGVEGRRITFVCFNNYAKVSIPLLQAWAEILRLVPGAQLLLKGSSLNEAEFRRVTQARLKTHGIDSARVILEPETSGVDEHFSRYGIGDIALDTFPYHGTTTTCDALWMGVPVVTWRGDRHASRVGASLLHAVGLNELVGYSGEEYVRLAVNLATDRDRLCALRTGLREKMASSELMNPVGLARSFEAAVARAVIGAGNEK